LVKYHITFCSKKLEISKLSLGKVYLKLEIYILQECQKSGKNSEHEWNELEGLSEESCKDEEPKEQPENAIHEASREFQENESCKSLFALEHSVDQEISKVGLKMKNYILLS